MDIDYILEKLYSYYGVFDNKQLAEAMDVKPYTIVNWKTRNSVNSIKKKCRELNIYKEIFENSQDENKNIILSQQIKEDINAKLFLFKRRSLVYLYYLLQKEGINSSIQYFNWQIHKEESGIFKNFIDDFWVDLSNDNVSFASYRNETDKYISHFITIDELDFIFSNKDIFLKSIIFMTNEKR